MNWSMEREAEGPRDPNAPKDLLPVIGVDGDPTRILGMADITEGRWMRRPNEIVVGSKLSRDEGLPLGSTVRLAGQSFSVAGQRAWAAPSSRTAWSTWTTAPSASGRRGDVVGVIIVQSGDPAKTQQRLIDLGGLDVDTPADLIRKAEQVNQTGVVLYWVMIGLTLVIASLFVSNMLARSVAERRLEFATLRAIGVPRRTILFTVGAEAVLISLAAGADRDRAQPLPRRPAQRHGRAYGLGASTGRTPDCSSSSSSWPSSWAWDRVCPGPPGHPGRPGGRPARGLHHPPRGKPAPPPRKGAGGETPEAPFLQGWWEQPQAMLELKNVWRTYGEGENEVVALRDVNLRIDDGEFVAIVGPSGSGKSTLLQIIGLLDRPTTGTTLLDGKPLDDLSDSARTRLRLLTLGFVFQRFHLLPGVSAIENVVLPMEAAGVPWTSATPGRRRSWSRSAWGTAWISRPSSPGAAPAGGHRPRPGQPPPPDPGRRAHGGAALGRHGQRHRPLPGHPARGAHGGGGDPRSGSGQDGRAHHRDPGRPGTRPGARKRGGCVRV